MMSYVASETTVIATLTRDRVHHLENKYYQLRDALMKVRISLIDGTANEFDFFRYSVRVKDPEVRKKIRAKFKAVFMKFIRRLRQNR